MAPFQNAHVHVHVRRSYLAICENATPRPPVQGCAHRYQRQIPWLRGQIWFRMGKFCHLPSSFLKTAFACILLHLRAGKKAKMPHLRRRIVRGKKKTIRSLVQRLANDQSSYARAALGPFRGPVCWRLFSLSPLSPLPSFSFLSLRSPPFPVLFSKPIWGSARQESSHTDGIEGI